MYRWNLQQYIHGQRPAKELEYKTVQQKCRRKMIIAKKSRTVLYLSIISKYTMLYDKKHKDKASLVFLLFLYALKSFIVENLKFEHLHRQMVAAHNLWRIRVIINLSFFNPVTTLKTKANGYLKLMHDIWYYAWNRKMNEKGLDI